MDKILDKKKIILIIGGGIAAYKSLDLIRLLKKTKVRNKSCFNRIGEKICYSFINCVIISKQGLSRYF